MKFPLFQYDITVIFIDDDIDFLGNLEIGLKKHKGFKKLFFSNPNIAIDYIEKTYRDFDIYGKFAKYDYPEQQEQKALTFDISKIAKEIDRKDKIKDFYIIVIDYDLQYTTGLSILEKLNKEKLYKILFTGFSVHEKVIKAFQNKLINNYLCKNDSDMLIKVKAMIEKAKTEIFYQESMPIIEAISIDKDSPTYILNDGYTKFLKKFMLEHYINEYYIFNGIGNFLFNDINNKRSMIYIADEMIIGAAIDSLSTEIKHIKENIELLNDVKRGKKMLCGEIKQKLSNSLYKCNPIPGLNELYYSIVKLNSNK